MDTPTCKCGATCGCFYLNDGVTWICGGCAAKMITELQEQVKQPIREGQEITLTTDTPAEVFAAVDEDEFKAGTIHWEDGWCLRLHPNIETALSKEISA